MKLKERTASAAANLEDNFEERCRFIDDRIDLEDTDVEIKKLWKAQDEAVETFKLLHESLDTTTLVLGDMGEKLKNFDARIMELNDVETSVDVKLSNFKDNAIQAQVNSCKNEAETAIKAVTKQSLESAAAVQGRLFNLEKSCKDLEGTMTDVENRTEVCEKNLLTRVVACAGSFCEGREQARHGRETGCFNQDEGRTKDRESAESLA